MELITKAVRVLQNGCKKRMFMKRYNIKGYEKSDEHVYCGEEFPKGYIDKRNKEKLYPRFLCTSCKKKIKKMVKEIELKKLREFYTLHKNLKWPYVDIVKKDF